MPGHASFTAAEQVAQVTAYDLSSQMLDVVAEAAKAKGLNNVTTRQGYAESLPFEDVFRRCHDGSVLLSCCCPFMG